MLTTFLVLSPERPNFPVQFVGILHATCECIYIDKIIISSSFEQISFRSISHSRNLSHHNFRCSPSYSKTRLHGLVRFPYIIVERKTLKLFLAEKNPIFGISHLCGESHMVFRGFRGGNQSSPTDHTVGKTDCQVTANKEGGELIRISQSKHACFC